MSKDPFADLENDPGFRKWAGHVRSELIPMISDSVMTMSLVPEDGVSDIKFAIELGLSIMMDKPIIALVLPGAKVSDHLRRVADEIVEWDPADSSNEDFQRMLTRVMEKHLPKESE